MVRTHKKTNKGKFLASRHNGRGNKKKGRGSGTRGGVGRGGAWKHKKTYTLKFERHMMGGHGFVNKTTVHMDIINLTEISREIEDGRISKKDNIYYFKFDGKVLGAGRLLYPAIVEARGFSKTAVDKIEQAGGETKTFEVEKNGS
jgi:large subunit ribosomal protein L15